MLEMVLLGFEKSGGVFVDRDGGDFISLCDFIDHVLAGDHLAEDGMFSVKVWSGKVGDEELAAVGVWSGVGHGKDAGFIVLE